ncbi:MAG: CpaF family protein [Chloroflexi bacterium]|nr:CpaF family protein [Chloroflexota bacterium]
MTFSISRRTPGARPPALPDETPTDTLPARIEAPPPPVLTTATTVRQDLRTLRGRLLQRVISELDTDLHLESGKVRRAIEDIFNVALEGEEIPLPRTERARLLDAIIADITSFGPIEALLNDDTVDEIMVNGPDAVYVERDGMIYETDVRFDNDDHVKRIIDRIIAPLGRRCDEGNPMVDARLPDGSRVNAIIPPIALNGPTITIRKFSRDPLTVEDLITFGTCSVDLVEFLSICVRGRLNLIISGGTGSGKTTLLNVLSSFIPPGERIITIEDAAELQLRQRHVLRLEKRPPNIEGRGEVTVRDLVVNSLRMRPDRIIIGECRGPEALDMLQAMNTGHDGGLTTIHANSPRDTLSRLETMVLMAGTELPLRAIREQITAAVDLIVHIERMADGVRRITRVTEVTDMEKETVVTQDIFEFRVSAVDGRRISGRLEPSGLRPLFAARLEQLGHRLSPRLFGVDQRPPRA